MYPLPTEVITFIGVLLVVICVQAVALGGRPRYDLPDPPTIINGRKVIKKLKLAEKRKPKVITDDDAYAREQNKDWGGSAEPPDDAA